MKKLITWLLVLALSAGLLTAAAFAEEPGTTADNPLALKYQDIDKSVYEGKWVVTGLGFDVYIPEEWVQPEITEEQAAAGLAFLAGEDGGGANLVITRVALPEEVAGSYDYKQLGQELAASNSTASYADMNGIPAVVFQNDETKVRGFCTLPGDGTLISGVISAPSDNEFESYAAHMWNILQSVSPTEAAESTTLVWENYEADVREIDPDGRFVSLDDAGVKLWVTSLLEQDELTDEDVEYGYIAYFSDAKGEIGMGVCWWDYEGITLEEYTDLIREDKDFTNPYYCKINGMDSINYMDAAQEYVYVDFVSEEGYVLDFCIWPASDTGYYSLAQFMIASVQPE